MSLDKIRQKQLFNWLKQQAGLYKTSLRLSVLAGFASGLLIVVQAWLLATLLQQLIIDNADKSAVIPYFIALVVTLIARALFVYVREQVNFAMGTKIRQAIRQQILDTLERLGPAYVSQKTTGNWSTLLIEQVEDLQDFYARYLPQMRLATMVPLLVLVAIFPINWAAAVILFCTAPLIPLFMILVGMGAADVNRRNFLALGRLSGHFLDRLKGIETIRLFNQGPQQTETITQSSEDFRSKTMEVLRMAFLSSAVLEFFASVSIAVVAVYFGFSYLGELHFGSYGLGVTLFAGFFALILAPEFFQPLRDLGTFYHAKAQAVAAADTIYDFLNQHQFDSTQDNKPLIKFEQQMTTIEATDLVVLSNDQQPIVGPLSFTLHQGQHIALVGKSGEGKTSLVNVLLGFLTYQGSLKINGIELKQLDIASWRQQLSWVGQTPYLPAATIRQNIVLSDPTASDELVAQTVKQAYVDEYVYQLPEGLDTKIGDEATRLSVGQAQRIAVARALLKPSQLFLFDEPTASLDKASAEKVTQALAQASAAHTVMTITHRVDDLSQFDEVWQLEHNQITVIRSNT